MPSGRIFDLSLSASFRSLKYRVVGPRIRRLWFALDKSFCVVEGRVLAKRVPSIIGLFVARSHSRNFRLSNLVFKVSYPKFDINMLYLYAAQRDWVYLGWDGVSRLYLPQEAG